MAHELQGQTVGPDKGPTMNLYKITMGHAAPKDFAKSMVCLLLAKDDEAVFHWIASDPKVGDHHIITDWSENAKDYEEATGEAWEDDNYPDFKGKIIALKGEIHDQDYDFSDAYYGITLYGWELLAEDFKEEIPAILRKTSIVLTA